VVHRALRRRRIGRELGASLPGWPPYRLVDPDGRIAWTQGRGGPKLKGMKTEGTVAKTGKLERLRITIRGAVQGVGFRPFIYRLAREMGLRGWVENSVQGVSIEVEGPSERLERFLLRIEPERPPRSFVQSLESSWLDPLGFEGFEIRQSAAAGSKTALVLPDIATCRECLREVFDPGNRRYFYPFTNCTNCGPRFSIIEGLPYDRANTSMKRFIQCAQCQAEYDDPLNRRFHAQPNACPSCGPHLELWGRSGERLVRGDGQVLSAAANAIRSGRVVAIKGLGGFHLVVAAHEPEAVVRLRELKHREEKPLALMCPSMASARGLCEVSALEERLLRSPESPIVLLRRVRAPVRPSRIAEAVAPGNPNLGVMLPCTPLHHLLLALLQFPIVATSGNLSDEPICTEEYEAVKRLGGIADLFLVHDRPIVRHVDDSIVRVMLGRELVLRRARGYAPLPVTLDATSHAGRRDRHNHEKTESGEDRIKGGQNQAGSTEALADDKDSAKMRTRASALLPLPGGLLEGGAAQNGILAVGAHLKNTIALTVGSQVFISQHIGDLETDQAYEAFRRVISDFERLYEARPTVVAADAHPDYLSSQYARERAGWEPREPAPSCVTVQHHVAHVLSCVVENRLAPPLLGISWDGTGYGLDGTIWGGEFFLVRQTACERVASLRQFRLPGGDKAVREPRRTALGVLYEMFGEEVFEMSELAPVRACSAAELSGLKAMLRRGFNSPLASSTGRLFDAVASLAGLRQTVRFEGQAAMELEFALEGFESSEAYEIGVREEAGRANPRAPDAAKAGCADSGGPTGSAPSCGGHGTACPPVLPPLIRLDWSPLVQGVLSDLKAGLPVGQISIRFHNALVEAIVAVARRVGQERIVLSGGCFQNRYLTERAVHRLAEEGFRPYWHQRVPPNDGGIALGQAAAVAWRSGAPAGSG
jgi:hydrogenase maturation protein HypF